MATMLDKDGRVVGFACTAHDIGYQDNMLGDEWYVPSPGDLHYCPVCEETMDVLNRCPFRNEPDHLEPGEEAQPTTLAGLEGFPRFQRDEDIQEAQSQP